MRVSPRAFRPRRPGSPASTSASSPSSSRLSKSARRQRVSSRGRAARDRSSLRVIAEHQARFGVAPICRALTAHGGKIAPVNLLCLAVAATVEAGAVGHRDHRNPRRLLRTRRAWSSQTRIALWRGEDMGRPSATRRHPGRPERGGAVDPCRRMAGCVAAQGNSHYRGRTGRDAGGGSGGPEFPGSGSESAGRRRFHLPAIGQRRVRLHRVRRRRLRRADRGLGMLAQQTGRVRGVGDPAICRAAGASGTAVDRVHDSPQRRRISIRVSERH